MQETAWLLYLFREMPAEVASIRYRLSDSWISNRGKKSLFVNIAGESLLMMR
jgi:hypothetical protein